jgi:hypothetical protein
VYKTSIELASFIIVQIGTGKIKSSASDQYLSFDFQFSQPSALKIFLYLYFNKVFSSLDATNIIDHQFHQSHQAGHQ